MIVLSPHFDDAAYSVGGYMMHAASEGVPVTMLTVFGGTPAAEDMLTHYDAQCGFSCAAHAMGVRAHEDDCAAAVMRVDTWHGDALDQQYGETDPVARERAFNAAWSYLNSTETLLAPLGIRHADHVYVSDQVLGSYMDGDSGRGREVLLYEELPYRVQHPEDTADRLIYLRNRGWKLEAQPVKPADLARKIAAVGCYASQLGPLGALEPMLLVPERVWSVTA